MREFFRHGAIVAAGLFGANALTYIYYALVTRSIGVDQAGEFTSLISAMVLLSLPANVAGNVLAKIVADANGRGHAGTAGRVMRQLTRMWVIFAAILAIAATLGSGRIASFFHISDWLIVPLAVAGFAFTFPLQPQRSVIQGAADFVPYAISYIWEAAAKTITGIAVLLFGGGLLVALAGYAIGAAASFAFNTFWGHRHESGVEETAAPRMTVVTSVLGIALPIGAITMISFTDLIIVQHFFSRHTSGLYGATCLVGRAISQVVGFIFVVLLPKVASRAAAGLSTTRLLLAAMFAAGAFLSVALILAGVFPEQVITLLAGKAFAEAAPYVFPYAIAMSALGLAAVLATYLFALGRKWFGISLALTAVAEVIVLILFHADIWSVLHIVVAGHCTVLLCCVVDVSIATIQGPRKKGLSDDPSRA